MVEFMSINIKQGKDGIRDSVVKVTERFKNCKLKKTVEFFTPVLSPPYTACIKLSLKFACGWEDD